MNRLTLLATAVTGASAFVSSPLINRLLDHQAPLRSGTSLGDLISDSSALKCEIPDVLDPSADGLPSASELYSSKAALEKQIERHQALVRVPSVCFDDLGDFDKDERWAPFYDVHDVLKETYPTVHKKAKLDKINTFGLLYTVQGSDPSLKPTMLTAHQDVVPVADASTWTHPPFDAVYDGEYLWGRGASDDKNSMTALMSALESLLSDKDFKPRRTILFAFGFDEECSGYKGAKAIDDFLVEKYGQNSVAIILDEGGMGINKIGDVLYALPAVTEKGHVDIWIDLHVTGGHSSIPAKHTGIGIMSEIVTALEAHPYEPLLTKDSPVYTCMSCIAKYTPEEQPGLAEMLAANDLEAVADILVEGGSGTQFMIQTSQAVDFIKGGQKINAMPEVVTLGVNYRVAQHNSIQEVQHNVVKYIGDIVERYNLTVSAFEDDEEYAAYVAGLGGEEMGELRRRWEFDYAGSLVLRADEVSNAAPVSPSAGDAVWNVFAGTIRHTFAFEDGMVVPAPQTMTGNTDTRHYLNLTPNVYRFTPVRDRSGSNAHTIDEKVNMELHMEIVSFYYDFIRNFDAADF